MSTKQRPVIVYVEDNNGDALLLREAFIDRGHEVELLIIEHGDKALHYFEVKARARDLPPPHCILLDDHLPMVTGIELITFIRGQDAFTHTPVFIFASPKEYADVCAAVHIAPDSFLKKPTEWERFCDLADMLMRGAWLSEHGSGGTAEPEKASSPPPQLRRDS